MKESEKIALAVLVAICFVVVSGFGFFEHERNNELEKKQIRDKAYLDGYLKGKADGAQQVIDLQHEANTKMWDETKANNN